MFRVSLFMEHIDDDCQVKVGPTTNTDKEDTTTTLSPASLEYHLFDFDRLGTRESWWQSPNTKLCSILLDNKTALEQRLELIAKAKHSVWTMTWIFEESDAGHKIADALIRRAEEGLDVRVIVDLITLSYLYEKKTLIGTSEMDILKKLSLGGVAVRMLGTWYMQEDKKNPAYIIGTHRKIMLVDDSYMLTGGRNIKDEYYSTHAFHFFDAEVLIQGNFERTTCEHYKALWEQSKDDQQMFP